MKYRSTRDTNLSLSAAETIARGLSREGGLFVPESIPQITPEFLQKLVPMTYPERSAAVMKLYLSDFSEEELAGYTKAAYANFYTENAAPLHRLDEKTSFMELWHGPTCAFKDIALQILPYLLTASLRKTNESKNVCILVATSGDTGKEALEGFKDVNGTAILVFYPRDGVSDVQKLQMQSQQGSNVSVCGVEGNFDDAQTGVSRSSPIRSLRPGLQKRAGSFPPPTQSTGAGSFPRSFTISPLTATCFVKVRSPWVRRSASVSRPATSGISSPDILRNKWGCLSNV